MIFNIFAGKIANNQRNAVIAAWIIAEQKLADARNIRQSEIAKTEIDASMKRIGSMKNLKDNEKKVLVAEVRRAAWAVATETAKAAFADAIAWHEFSMKLHGLSVRQFDTFWKGTDPKDGTSNKAFIQAKIAEAEKIFQSNAAIAAYITAELAA